MRNETETAGPGTEAQDRGDGEDPADPTVIARRFADLWQAQLSAAAADPATARAIAETARLWQHMAGGMGGGMGGGATGGAGVTPMQQEERTSDASRDDATRTDPGGTQAAGDPSDDDRRLLHQLDRRLERLERRLDRLESDAAGGRGGTARGTGPSKRGKGRQKP